MANSSHEWGVSSFYSNSLYPVTDFRQEIDDLLAYQRNLL